jgi:hypothetical protein
MIFLACVLVTDVTYVLTDGLSPHSLIYFTQRFAQTRYLLPMGIISSSTPNDLRPTGCSIRKLCDVIDRQTGG